MTDAAEVSRILQLHALGLLDSPPEPVFDRVTRLLARSLDVPIALVSLVDAHRQWFKSSVGVAVQQTPREIAFCDHAIRGRDTLVVEDARQDPRFAGNPLVTGAPNIRFYAGVPLCTRSGHALGTLCAIDDRPRQLSAEQRLILEDLAQILASEIQMREAALLGRAGAEQADRALGRSEARFQAVFEGVGSGLAIVAPDGRWLSVNRAMAAILGYSREELAHLTFQDVTVPEDLDADLALLEQLVAGQIDRYKLEKRYLRKDGRAIWAHLTVTKHLDAQGRLDYFLAVVEDIGQRKAAEQALGTLTQELEDRVSQRTLDLRKREAELAAVLEYTDDAYVCTDDRGTITAWNRKAEDTFGWTRAEALGAAMHEMIIPPELRAAHQAGMARFQATGEAKVLNRRIELPALCKDGRVIPVEVHISAVPVEGRMLFNAFLHEISARKREEERREAEALLDPLTGLPNRRALLERLPPAVARVTDSGAGLALMFLDLDGFKPVNDAYGHDIGDRLLQDIAQRLRGVLRAGDAVFRLAGDEFTVLLEGLDTPSSAEAVARKLLVAVNQPVAIEAHRVTVAASIGLALCLPGDPRGPEQLLKDADQAMYAAKKAGRNRFHLAAAGG